jgi:UDP-glucose 4-epimerase
MPIKQSPPINEDFNAMGNSVYGVTKHLGELYTKRFASPWIILRYAHLYGKEKRMHGLIGGFLERIERGLAPTLYGGKQSNDFTYIKDVARANYLALTSPWDKWNSIYNIGTGEELTAERAGKIICEATGYKGKIEKKDQRTVDPDRFVYDCSKAERMLGFKAEYNFKDGLFDMFKKSKVEGEKKQDETRKRNKNLETRTIKYR